MVMKRQRRIKSHELLYNGASVKLFLSINVFSYFLYIFQAHVYAMFIHFNDFKRESEKAVALDSVEFTRRTTFYRLGSFGASFSR